MKRFIGLASLTAVALIFGVSYIFQSMAAEHIGPFTLNAIRFIAGGLFLLPTLAIKDNTSTKKLLFYSVVIGVIIFAAPNLQQAAIATTSVGKAAFITTMYIVLVPILNFFFLHTKLNIRVIISVVMALVGLYILCDLKINDLSFRVHDLFLIATAALFSLQIVIIGHFVTEVNPLKVSALSNLIGGILSLVFMFTMETPTMADIKAAAGPLVFLTLVSTILGFTLQLIGQRNIDSTTASLLMSLESVFSAISGYLFLKQTLTGKEIIGCIIMFAAVILCQLPEKSQPES